MMAVIQGMCARIGMVTGRGLAANIRKSVPLPLAYLMAIAVVAANTFNVGADFAGMAASANMVVPKVHVLLWVLFAFVGNPGIPKPIVNAISELQDGRSPADDPQRRL